ncbi:MAG: 30S ribosomal protein S4e [Candidatus Aenigmarchaeota archaeon]|nr:30S ribosomal protein S4e [Candidatus Aenigmarchaeota archaeon]
MSGYLKRYVMPAFWPVNRKGNKWVSRPRTGPHKIEQCISLQILVRDSFSLTDNVPETKKLIKSGAILVDKRKRTDIKYPVGFMDVIEIPSVKKYYRVMLSSKGLHPEEIKETDSSRKLCIVKGKKAIKGGKFQLSLHDGRNVIVLPKNDYKVNDSVIISLPEQKIAKHFKFEKGAASFITAGKNIGITGTIEEIKERKTMLEKAMVTIKTKDNKSLLVPKKYVMVGEV